MVSVAPFKEPSKRMNQMTHAMLPKTLLAAAILLAGQSPHAYAVAAASNTFEQNLANDYQALSQAESQPGDERDAATYAARAAAASSGQPTAPDQLELRQDFLKERYVGDLSQARERLVGALAKTARSDAPAAAARAQSSFDCWLEQASEDLQPDDINACRQSFNDAMAAVESAMQPVAAAPMARAVVPEVDSDGDGVVDRLDRCPNTPAGTKVNADGCPDILMTLTGVNFKFDSSQIDPSATDILDRAVSALHEASGVAVRIEGHTDSTGTEAYNLLLSQRRADAVRAYLAQHGIAAARLSTSGQGEGHPVDSNDTEAGRFQNRRVELHVLSNAP